jgi:hypothetical protein
MQIHELTQLNEAGVLDRIRQAGSAVKAGAQNISAQAAADNVAQASAQQQKTQDQAAKYAEILRKQGFTGQTAPAPTSAVGAGQRVLVTAPPPGQPTGPKANYYKTDKGWENELGQPITNPTSVAYLEKLYAGTARPAAGAVQSRSAQAVRTGGAGAVMTGGDIDQAIRQLGLSPQQLQAFQTQATQNPGFVPAFLKRLGITR